MIVVRCALFVVVGILVFGLPVPASAIPVFAHRYGVSCQTCHTTVPHLNATGEAFLASGYAFPNAPTGRAFPIAVKTNLAYASEPDASGLPKAVVDEIELLTGGSAGHGGSYFAEVYVVDGGRPGSVRDAWFAQALGPAQVTVGQFTLPVPIDPETFRETSAHYTLYDQTVGGNPFNFFDAKPGASVQVERADTTLTLAALSGHDKQSGLPARGIDRMIAVQSMLGAIVASVYRYDGTRFFAGTDDRFWRQGYALGLQTARLRIDATLQTGNDAGQHIRSSGGFLQARYAFTPALAATIRYDGTSDTGFARSLLVGASKRVSRNARLTVEDIITHGTQTKHVFNTAYLFAY